MFICSRITGLAALQACLLSGMIIAFTGSAIADEILLDFTPEFSIESIAARDATPELTTDSDGRTWLKLTTGTRQRWPGITLNAPKAGWDFSHRKLVAMDIRNLDDQPMTVNFRIDSTSNDGSEQTIHMKVGPGETVTLSRPIIRRLPKPYAEKLFAMRGFPGGCHKEWGLVDPSHITRLFVFIASPKRKHVFCIDKIRLAGEQDPSELPQELKPDFFPMIDRYGQYKHKRWPGKTYSDDDFKRHHRQELEDLAKNPGTKNRSRWGGWSSGPKLEATGHFRTTKINGRWWFVDPDGHLFWSHGIDCVRIGNATTPLDDREHLFEQLPEKDSPLAKFYGYAAWAPHHYYHGRGRYRTFSFDGANITRKYGEDAAAEHAAMAHRRIRSWGMNTIANWSDPKIYGMRRTPYTATIHFSSPKIAGSLGYWGQFPDPFDPAFRKGIRMAVTRQAAQTRTDPWCIGYFVHNELGWKDDTSLARASFASGVDQPAKLAMFQGLKKKYKTIATLNAAWKTSYSSWESMLQSTKLPADCPKLVDDLKAFYSQLAETYFRVISEELKTLAPNKLYFGCRFSNDNDSCVRAAGKYCDVISFNRYRYTIDDVTLPEGTDRPIQIGEFHFGALDRGMFHTGLRATANQAERANAYRKYVTSGLRNPLIVGTHWFQYRDQATTGRGDGENYQIGFVDVCDTPYPEIIKASRQIGREMYKIHSNPDGK